MVTTTAAFKYYEVGIKVLADSAGRVLGSVVNKIKYVKVLDIPLTHKYQLPCMCLSYIK